MQVIGSELLSDPILQSSIVDQKLPWMTERSTPTRSKKNKNTTRSTRNVPKKILNLNRTEEVKVKTRHGEPHPILFQCSKHIDDEYWSEILEDISYGEFPKGFSIKSNSLSYKKSATRLNNISLVQSDDYAELAQLIVGFISTNANMYSPEDIKNSKILELHHSQLKKDDIETIDWKSIKSRNVQAIHLYNYAVSLSEKYDIPIDNIYSVLIFNVFLTDHIEPESIIFENGIISHIEGLSHDEKTNTIYFNHDLKEVPELFICDPLSDTCDVDVISSMNKRSTDYSLRGKSKYSLTRLWKQTLRDVSKDVARPTQRSNRTSVLTTLSMINHDDLTRLESSIID